MIIGPDGQPIRAASRLPIQAQHMTRLAVWTQETERRIRQEHSAEGHHDTGFHAIGGVWLQINTSGQPLTIGRQSFWRDRVQGDSLLGPWSGSSTSDHATGTLTLSGDTIPAEAMLILHARDLRPGWRTSATWIDGTTIQLESRYFTKGVPAWLFLLIYGV